MPRAGSWAKACTEVSTPERTRKVPSRRERESEDGEKHRPALQRIALLDDDGGMQQRGAGEPRHQRGVLDRIPEPEAAPAEDVVGPPAAERDAEGEEAPRRERPRPHPARPGGVDPAFEQGGDGEGVGHREADIAEIEQRRMEGETGILQQRVEAVAVERRRREALERVRGEEQEGQEADADQRLDASTRLRRVSGRLAPKTATAAPNSDRISAHSSIEPSWFPHTPEIL